MVLNCNKKNVLFIYISTIYVIKGPLKNLLRMGMGEGFGEIVTTRGGRGFDGMFKK